MSSLALVFEPPDDATPDELRARLRALADLVARAPVPIAVAHDAECRFISANHALSRLLATLPDSNISMAPAGGEVPAYRIQRDGADIPTSELPMQYAIAHRTHLTNDIEIVRADGSVVFVQNDVEPLYDRHGNVCGCVSVCVDLTERKQIEHVLRETDRVKNEFLATLSHELRNPLAPIRNALEVLRRPGHDERLNQRALAIMERQLQQLVRLTDDLLDVSRITRNKIELRRTHTDLRAVVHSAVEAIEPLSDAAGHVISIDVPDTPLWVFADFTRLSQAIGNLLNNAVKYTNRGGRIAVCASVADGEALITVSDNGIGIESELLPRIFDMFMQVEQDSTRLRSGLGIGLTLTKRLIELHGGQIDARSVGSGAGTTFAVRLPISTPVAGQVSTATRKGRAAPRRVLVAEDIPDAAEMMRIMIECMGHDVRVANDGVEAVALAREFNPDIVLLDIGMPRMDGYEAARQIRAELGSRVLLVALTGWGQEEDQRRALAAGFNKHVTKPAEPDIVEALIGLAAGGR